MEPEQVPKAKQTPVEAALLIAFLSVLAYVGAYAFEASYLAYFGVPQFLTELDLRELLSSGIFAWTLPCIAILDIGYALWPRNWPRLVQATIGLHIGLYILVAVVMYLTAPRLAAILLGIAAVIMSSVQFVVPIWKAPRERSYPDKLLSTMSKFPIGQGIVLALENPRLRQPLFFVISIIAVYLTGAALGEVVARNTTRFLVTAEESEPTCVVIHASSRGLLCVRYDLAHQMWLPGLRFLEPTKSKFALMRLGPLPRVRVGVFGATSSSAPMRRSGAPASSPLPPAGR